MERIRPGHRLEPATIHPITIPSRAELGVTIGRFKRTNDDGERTNLGHRSALVKPRAVRQYIRVRGATRCAHLWTSYLSFLRAP